MRHQKPVVTVVDGEWVVVLHVDVEEARNIAYALGPQDDAQMELFYAADEAERLNNERRR